MVEIVFNSCSQNLDVEHYVSEGEIDINDTDDASYTALDYAIEGKHIDMIKLLVEAGANAPKMVADSAYYLCLGV